MTQPTLMLLTPTFHGYGASIARGFEAIGLDVHVHEYDKLGGFKEKLLHKAGVELPAKLRLKKQRGVTAGEAAAAEILRTKPDIVIIIRGDDIEDSVFDAIENVGAKKILWLWDELRRTRHSEESLDRFPQLITYSPLDAEALQAAGRECIHVANAFDHTMIPTKPFHTHGILFIGARYPRRLKLILDLANANVPVTAVGRTWSRHVFDRLRTWEWKRPDIHSRRDVPRMLGYEMTAGAPAALNIHFDQDGFTMKTFEAPGVGGVQLIDRPDVEQYYEPGKEVLVYETPEELVDLARRCISDDRWGDQIREAGKKRTLAEHTFVHRAKEVSELWA